MCWPLTKQEEERGRLGGGGGSIQGVWQVSPEPTAILNNRNTEAWKHQINSTVSRPQHHYISNCLFKL